jgi:mono/diheme cytochrome c family protein
VRSICITEIKCDAAAAASMIPGIAARADTLDFVVMPRDLLATLAAVALVVGARVATPSTSAQEPDAKSISNPVPASPESVSAGAQSYSKLCVLCHGATAGGDGKLAAATAAYGVRPSNLTDDTWQHGSTDGEIFVVIRDGIGPDFNMPAYAGRLSEVEIWNIVNYIRSLGPRKK